MVAAFMVSGVPMEKVLEGCKQILGQLRNFLKKPTQGLVSVHELIVEFANSVLPHNAHELCNNRVGISISKATWPLQNMLASRFESRQDLLDAAVAGCFIPLWSGSLEFPKYQGRKCIDGGYSNNMPQFPDLDERIQQHSSSSSSSSRSLRHLKICAFASETDICPPHKHGIGMRSFGTVYYLNWNNVSRGLRTLMPFEAKDYMGFFLNGFQDMKNYILNNDMVKCQQCAWVSPPDPIRWSCLSCLKLMEKIDSLKVPQSLMNIAAD